jgi:hypothetical protein
MNINATYVAGMHLTGLYDLEMHVAFLQLNARDTASVILAKSIQQGLSALFPILSLTPRSVSLIIKI